MFPKVAGTTASDIRDQSQTSSLFGNKAVTILLNPEGMFGN
jgi:hypothetical protein